MDTRIPPIIAIPTAHGTRCSKQRGVGMGMDERAIEAIKQYKFAPFLKDGQPVVQATSLQLKFDAE